MSSSFSRMDTPANLGFVVVPQQNAMIVERFGRFHTVLEPGLRLLIPFAVSYTHLTLPTTPYV